jgi:elongation factor 1 alpha-like protein
MPPKSGVSRTRNVGYDDDDLYDDEYYDDEGDDVGAGDGMSEEDKEQMRVGTIRVREAMGDMSDFTSDEQIQEALWHYYYDVGKSVSYLKNKLGVAEPKKEAPKQEKAKPASRFDQAASVAGQNAPTPTGKHTHMRSSHGHQPARPVAHHLPLPPLSMPTNAAATDFFWDVPWGNVPPERLANITVDAPAYKGGLLGGSSKLAALAARRRKEREDAEAAASKANNDADLAVAMLDKLSVKNQENVDPSRDGAVNRPVRTSKYPVRRRSPSPAPETPKEPEIEEPRIPQPAIVVEAPAQRAIASMFASTLCGSNKLSKQPQPQVQELPVPFVAYKSYDGTQAFSGPSPDDIVRAAQAKSAGGGRN